MKDTFYIVQRLSGFSFFSALVKVIWGAVFLSPDDTFSVNPISYRSMMTIATEIQWGWFLLIVGLIHLWGIFDSRLRLRIAAQILSIGVWLFIATQFWVSNPIGTGKFTYLLAACIDFIVIIYLLHFRGGHYK